MVVIKARVTRNLKGSEKKLREGILNRKGTEILLWRSDGKKIDRNQGRHQGGGGSSEFP